MEGKNGTEEAAGIFFNHMHLKNMTKEMDLFKKRTERKKYF